MASLTAITQTPAFGGPVASATYTQPATAEAPVYIDFGFVPSMVIVTVDAAASGWMWTASMADATCAALYGAVDVAAAGVTPYEGVRTTANDHVVSGGAAYELVAGDAYGVKGILLGTAVDGGNSATVHVVAWK